MNNIETEKPKLYTVPVYDYEPKWMNIRRQAALDSYNKLLMPQKRLHLWRYTDPEKFLVERNIQTRPRTIANTLKQGLNRRLVTGSLSAAALDQSGKSIWTQVSDDADDLVILPMSRAFAEYEEIIERYLYQLVDENIGKFEAFGSALWQDGIFVYLPDGKTVEKPVHLIREVADEQGLQFFRLLVVVGKNAEMTLIDEYMGGSSDPNQKSHAFGAVEIFGGQDSRIRYVNLQRQESGVTSYLTHRARIERGSSILTIPLAFGGKLAKQNFGVTLNGPGADSKMYGLLFGSKRQHFDNHTLHHHASGQTTSDIDFKVVLRDKAISAYTGLIRIEQEAANCEAYQENRNLLLGGGAKAETIPELEILNEEVMCSHGATVGPIDPEMLFYLTSRGYTPEDAVRTVVTGFVASTLKMVPADIRGGIRSVVTDRLEGI